MDQEPLEPLEALDAEREFREQQRTGLGATDTPKILGLSRYGTPRTVYEKKLSDPSEAGPTSLPAWVGLSIQGTVAELYVAATGYKVRQARRHYRHKEDEWVVCHLDYRVWGSPFILVECKTRSRMTGWGADGSQDVPPDVYAQAQHEMLVLGAQECHVAVLFGHHTFRVYPIQRNDLFLDRLRTILHDFWHDNVLAGVPPPLIGHPMDSAIAQRDNPTHGPVYRNATPGQMRVIEELMKADRVKREADVALEGAKNRIKDIIGDALGLIGPFGRITWKQTKGAKTVGWEQIAAAYRKVIEDITGTEDVVEIPDLDTIVGLYTTEREGYRRFTMDWEEV